MSDTQPTSRFRASAHALGLDMGIVSRPGCPWRGTPYWLVRGQLPDKWLTPMGAHPHSASVREIRERVRRNRPILEAAPPVELGEPVKETDYPNRWLREVAENYTLNAIFVEAVERICGIGTWVFSNDPPVAGYRVDGKPVGIVMPIRMQHVVRP